MVSHAFLSFLHQGGRGRQMPVNLMPAWSTASFPGQPRLHMKLSLSTQLNLLENCPCPQRLQRSRTILEAETQHSADSKAASALFSDSETPELWPIISALYVSTSLHYSVTIAWNWPRRGTVQKHKTFPEVSVCSFRLSFITSGPLRKTSWRTKALATHETHKLQIKWETILGCRWLGNRVLAGLSEDLGSIPSNHG